jgi:hypothetical protein
MNPMPHYEKVDTKNIEEKFSSNRLHRFSLTIPLLERSSNKTLCIIGQNPSKANEEVADKTLNYLERYVFENMPEYSKIIMLNLYTRVDTNKHEKTNLEDPAYSRYLRALIDNHPDYLIVIGKVKSEGSYKFKEKAKELKLLLKGKNIYRLRLPGADYAPHPGNPKILYNNSSLDIATYDFSDIK